MSEERTQAATPNRNPITTGEYVPDATPEAGSTRPTGPHRPGAAADLPDIPGYVVTHELARGGMGRVLEAYDLAFGREVAIKVVLPGPDAAATAGRFVRESRITGRLTHPGIPPAYQLGELADGSPFLAMKLVRGRTLAELLAERPDVGHDLPRFVAIFEQVCQAVGYAHSRGIIHRDLKPANVMVGAFGEVQVMDWGLARDTLSGAPDPDGPPVRPWDATGSTIGDDRTQAGAVMGTPAYMAPEQARGEEVNARADVFALGGVLSMILVGRAPFQSSSAELALALAAAGDPAAGLAALVASGADAELVGVARRCLAAERADRPADGREVAKLVAAYRQGVEDRLRAAERDRAAADAKTVEARKRRRAQAALAGAALLLVAGGGGVAVWRAVEDGEKRATALQLEGEERTRLAKETAEKNHRQSQAADAVANLLRQARAELEAGDADRADKFLAQADRQAAAAAVTDHVLRQLAYRNDVATLRQLDQVDAFRWTLTADAKYTPPPGRVAELWAAALAGYGIVPGVTPSDIITGRLDASPIRTSLIAALDGWLARTPLGGGGAIRAVLDVADPHLFRGEVRRLIAEDRGSLVPLSDRPEWATQPSGLIQAYHASGALSRGDSQRYLHRAVAARRNDFGLLMQLGYSYPSFTPAGAGDRARCYQAAVALRPQNVMALHNLGFALADAGDADGAVAAFRVAIDLAPDNANTHHGLGYALTLKRDMTGACAAFREAIRLNPSFPHPYNDLGAALISNGAPSREDLEEAINALRAAVRLDPNYDYAFTNLGKSLSLSGDTKAAITALRRAIACNPENATAHARLADLLGSTTEAVAAYRKSIQHNPRDPFTHASLGRLLGRIGDLDGAADETRMAIQLNPHFAPFHADLRNVYQKRGRLDEAVTAYRTAVAIQPSFRQARECLDYCLRVQRGEVPTAPPPRAVTR